MKFTKILCIGLLATSALSASAQDKPTAATPPAAVASPAAAAAHKNLKYAPFKGTIASVDKAAQTVTLNGEKKQLIHITPQTKITKDEQPATFDSLSQGLKITGFKMETSTNVWEAKSLRIMTVKTAPKLSPKEPSATK